MGRRWSAGVREGVEPVQGIGDHVGPGPVAGEAEVAAAAGGDELGGDGEEAKPQSAGFPEAGFAGQREQGNPGEQVERDLDDLQATGRRGADVPCARSAAAPWASR